MLTPEQRSLKARVAIHARWAHEDGKANAQRGLKAKFLRQASEEFPEAGKAQIRSSPTTPIGSIWRGWRAGPPWHARPRRAVRHDPR